MGWWGLAWAPDTVILFKPQLRFDKAAMTAHTTNTVLTASPAHDQQGSLHGAMINVGTTWASETQKSGVVVADFRSIGREPDIRRIIALKIE